MTDEQIIKALECCKDGECRCEECPYGVGECLSDNYESIIFKDAFDLVHRQKKKIKEFDRRIVIQRNMIVYQKAEIEELKEKHAEDERVLNDRIQESVNAVSEADQKYIRTLERSIAAKDVKIERLLQKLQQAKSEAIKDFAERLKEKLLGMGTNTTYGKFKYGTVKSYEIDNLLKEMEG